MVQFGIAITAALMAYFTLIIVQVLPMNARDIIDMIAYIGLYSFIIKVALNHNNNHKK